MAQSNGITIRRTTKPAPGPAPARVRYVRLTQDFEAIGIGNVPLGFFATQQEAQAAVERHSYRMAVLTGAKGGVR
jgi:hypothetical protein